MFPLTSECLWFPVLIDGGSGAMVLELPRLLEHPPLTGLDRPDDQVGGIHDGLLHSHGHQGVVDVLLVCPFLLAVLAGLVVG